MQCNKIVFFFEQKKNQFVIYLFNGTNNLFMMMQNNIQVNIQESPKAPEPVPAPSPTASIKKEATDAISIDGNGSSDSQNDLIASMKRRFLRQPIPKKLKRLRRNRRLRKILTPKNALMSLHELLGTGLSDFTIVPEERGFIATVYVNNVQYEGHGKYIKHLIFNFWVFFNVDFDFDFQVHRKWQLKIMHQKKHYVILLFNAWLSHQRH